MRGHVKLLFPLLLLPLIGSFSQAVRGESLVGQENCAATFTELEEYIFSNQTSNHEILESTFFPINELTPSYVQVQYNHNCTRRKLKLLECSSQRSKFSSPDDKTWLWASSPVYLVYHPEALNALAMTIDPVLGSNFKLASVFNLKIGGETVCVCLPSICPNATASREMLQNLTALLYSYASVRTLAQRSLDNIWYAVLIEELWETNYNITPRETQLATLIYIFINLSNLSLNIVLIPPLVYACQWVMEKIRGNHTGSFVFSSVWWALFTGAIFVLSCLGLFNFSSVCWRGTDCSRAGFALPTISATLRLLIPLLGYILAIALKLRITRKFSLPFGLQIVVTAIQYMNQRCAEIIYTFCNYIVLLVILLAIHSLCSHLQFVVFASFDNPFRVLSNVTKNLSVAMLITACFANVFMVDLMLSEAIFTRSTKNISQYVKQLFQFVQLTLSLVIFSAWLYAFSYLGARQHNEFVDGLQTVLEFFTVPLTIGLLGYTIKITVYRMKNIVDPPS